MNIDNVSWTAFLSDGRSVNEQDLFVPDEELPFRKLVRLCVRENLKVNAITVTVKGIRYNSPSLGERGNFASEIKPEKFWIMYRDKFLVMQNKAFSFIGLSWKVGNSRTTIWIGTTTDKPISWVEVMSLNTSEEELINRVYDDLE
jgi:hypothetical protein